MLSPFFPEEGFGPENAKLEVKALFYLFEIQQRLEEIIGVQKVDLIQKGAIHPALREHILSEAVNVA